MNLLSAAGWFTYGAVIRGFQLGIQNRPFHIGKRGYIYSGLFWTTIGYGYNTWFIEKAMKLSDEYDSFLKTLEEDLWSKDKEYKQFHKIKLARPYYYDTGFEHYEGDLNPELQRRAR